MYTIALNEHVCLPCMLAQMLRFLEHVGLDTHLTSTRGVQVVHYTLEHTEHVSVALPAFVSSTLHFMAAVRGASRWRNAVQGLRTRLMLMKNCELNNSSQIYLVKCRFLIRMLYLHSKLILSKRRCVTSKLISTQNGVFWDVTPCVSCKNRRFGET
jgi:hypothetical protein